MNNVIFTKKISKLIKNPNLFFYDFFRKRVFINNPAQEKVTIQKEKENNNNFIDIMQINRLGLSEYIRKNLSGGVAPEDGQDKNGLLIWSGYLNGLIHFISNIKSAMSMDLTIYTLGGGYNVTSSVDSNMDIKSITGKLQTKPDFIVELSNKAGKLEVLHFYLYDINSEGNCVVRSNRAILRKCPASEIQNLFILEKNNSEKIDAVYTWVNQADSEWQTMWQESFPDNDFDPDRFTSNDELKYSLRSLNKYAPWLNKIYIVSNCKQPNWLTESDKIVWVDHQEIFPDNSMLPTFNSHAIECCLHRIPSLQEKFIYMNDDFILSQPCLPSDFFDDTGRSISYFESYGMVNPSSINTTETDYLLAAINSNILLKKDFKNYNARNLHKHVPYSLKKSVLIEIEEIYPEEFKLTRNAKLRSPTDVNLTSFLYHHFSNIKGHAIKSDTSSLIVRPENIKNLLAKDCFKYKILCFNDGNGSANDENYKNQTQEFFNRRLAEPASWELLNDTEKEQVIDK